MDKLKILFYSLELTKHKLLSSRFRSLCLIYAGFVWVNMSSIRSFIEATNCPVSIYIYPIMLIHIKFRTIISFCCVYLFSDVPFLQYSKMYSLIRMGRIKWALAQILSIFETAFLFCLYMCIVPVVLCIPNVEFTGEWGKIIHTLSLTNMSQVYAINIYVPYEVLVRLKPMEAMFLAVGLSTLLISFFGVFMFALSLVFKRNIAIVAASVVIGWSVAVYNIYKLLFPYAPVLWLDISQIGQLFYGMKRFPDLRYILLSFLLMISVSALAAMWAIRSRDLEWVNED
ncbi:MAG: hypothetical protein D8H95_12300 [Lachnospiraceae bacterium]|nr:MAG: hypothetical protein D8H95_12300 [Lachnospiraceae bacterium]